MHNASFISFYGCATFLKHKHLLDRKLDRKLDFTCCASLIINSHAILRSPNWNDISYFTCELIWKMLRSFTACAAAITHDGCAPHGLSAQVICIDYVLSCVAGRDVFQWGQLRVISVILFYFLILTRCIHNCALKWRVIIDVSFRCTPDIVFK